MDDSEFISYRNSLRIVVLTQLSSCAVERLFSQIKHIVDSVGHNTTEEITGLRMFLTRNGDFNVYHAA